MRAPCALRPLPFFCLHFFAAKATIEMDLKRNQGSMLCSVTLQQLWSLRSLLLFCHRRQQQRVVKEEKKSLLISIYADTSLSAVFLFFNFRCKVA
jgi:hypothetical protein